MSIRIMKRTLFLLFLSILALWDCMGQSTLQIGEWRAHLPYRKGITVTQSPGKVYYGAENGLLAIDKETEAIDFFSKVDGLTENTVSRIKYHAGRDVLIVTYASSNIDLVYPDRIVNLNNIVTNNSILGSKRINRIFVDDSDLVYFSCGFGLVELDLATGKFGFTLFTSSPVNGFARFREAYFIATDAGLYRFTDFEDRLVSDFSSWTFLGPDSGLPENYVSQDVAVHDGLLYAGVNGEVYAYDDVFYFIAAPEGQTLEYLSPEGSFLMAGFLCNTGCIGIVLFINEDGVQGNHGFNCAARPRYVIEDESGRLWYADAFEPFRSAAQWTSGCEPLGFNTPWSKNVGEIAIQDNVVYVSGGGVNDGYGYLLRPDGFFILRDGIWTFQNRTNNAFLGPEQENVLDYFRIAPHPDGSKVFIGSYWAGLLEYDFDNFKIYKSTNSPIQNAVGDPRERISGLHFDADYNLWISNYLAPRPIVVLKNDGSWKTLDVPGPTKLSEIDIDERGYKWFVLIDNAFGLMAFDDGGTIDDESDDRYQLFNQNNSGLPTNTVYALQVDLDGDIWVGTNNGPVVFDGAADPFSNVEQGFRITIEQDGLISYLLGEERIQTIAIDGANRKWFGTPNGIFVQSPDGEEQIATYTASNSPLLSDDIIDIAINDANGEVFVGTSEGLVSLRSEAIAGGRVHQSSVYAYPNPVREDYDGPIAIRGLPRDANVKITDVHGQLIFETQALGGQAIWYGQDFSGRRASTGVYLVFTTNEDTFNKPDAHVAKILFIH